MSLCVKGIKGKDPRSNPITKAKIGGKRAQLFLVAAPQNEVELMSRKLSCQGGGNGRSRAQNQHTWHAHTSLSRSAGVSPAVAGASRSRKSARPGEKIHDCADLGGASPSRKSARPGWPRHSGRDARAPSL